MHKNIIIIGGVAGGATAAARLRRMDEEANIILLERGGYVSFANCGLPYYIGGVIRERDALFVSTPEEISRKYKIDVRVNSEALRIDREKKEVEVKDLKSGESYTLPYDKLLLSTGSRPIKPPVEGFEADNVFTLWNIPDTDKIYSYIREHGVKKAAVIGGGFIGLEMAENFAHRGIEVSVIEKADQVMAPLDFDMAQIVEQHLRDKGVKLIVNNGVQKILHREGISEIVLEDESSLEAEMVILSIGIRPNSELAREAGLELNARGGVVVDEYMQTSDPNILAVGDIIEVDHFVLGNKTMIPLAGPANKQGRIAADNIALGPKRSYKGTQGTSVAKIFDLSVAATGLNEKALRAAGKEYGKDYKITLIHPNSHAGYYPGAAAMSIKLIFGSEGRVLGAQIVGYDGVDKRIDVIAAVIRMKGSVEDLAELELAYAPPYSSAKDPVNMAGFTAMNQLEGLIEVVRAKDLADRGEETVLIDVREDMERMSGTLPGALPIPLGSLRGEMKNLDQNKTYVLSCAVGLRGYIGARLLIQNGFKAKNLLGGYRSYRILHPDQDAPAAPLAGFKDNGELIGSAATGEAREQKKTEEMQSVKELDVCGLCCPGPIVEVAKAMEELETGALLRVSSTDPGFYSDIVCWVKNTGNELVERSCEAGKFFALISKQASSSPAGMQSCTAVQNPREKSMIVFSSDLDKAIASFIIANGAVAMGDQVNMFFTFWGLNILRKDEAVPVKKNLISKMFAGMMPRGSKKLGLSKMNMLGMGTKMIRKVMKDHNIYSLEDLIRSAQKAGIRMIACQMSMDVMGITKEELIDGVEIGGVATMLAANDNSNMNLFI